MLDSVSRVREAAQAIGLTIPEDRLEALATAVETALEQVESVRGETTPPPSPTSFDPAWSTKK